ncbi:MAG: hypothetical protein ACTSR8_04390 [Promethearchaeota archaeon]
MKDSLLQAFNQLIDALEDIENKYGIRYYLVGGILANVYSVFRLTQDIDFVVDTDSKGISINEYILILKKYNFIPMQDWHQAEILARETGILQYFDKNDRVKFDNYILDRTSASNYKKLGPIGLERRIKEILFGIECWVASKEDFILSKLTFGGWQDYSDALGCWLRFKDILDHSYLNSKSHELKVEREFRLLASGVDDPDDYFEKLNGY